METADAALIAASMARNPPYGKSVFDVFCDDLELQDAFPNIDCYGYSDLGEDGSVTIEGFDDLGSLPAIDADAPNGHMDHLLYGDLLQPDVSRTTSDSVGNIPSLSALSRPSGASNSYRLLLDAWLDLNRREPYLRPGDAEALAHLTRLTTRQVQTYVANARARRLTIEGPLLTPSLASAQSLCSSQSLLVLNRPRRARRASSAVSIPSITNSTTPKKYRCFLDPCGAAFGRRSDFKRHLESVHFPQEAWICMITHPVSGIGLNAPWLQCHFCGYQFHATESNAEMVETHLMDVHSYRPCIERPEGERTFTRKDKLKQHLQQVHGQQSPLTAWQCTWARPVNQDVLHSCPFCSCNGLPWHQYVDHLIRHFDTDEADEHSADAVLLQSIDREINNSSMSLC